MRSANDRTGPHRDRANVHHLFDRRVAPVGALVIISVLAACSDRAAEKHAQADADLARDLALVQTTSTAQPIFRDTAITDAPAARPAPRRPKPVARPATRVAPRREATRSRQPERPIRQRETRPARSSRRRPRSRINPRQPAVMRRTRANRARFDWGEPFSPRHERRVCTRSSRPVIHHCDGQHARLRATAPRSRPGEGCSRLPRSVVSRRTRNRGLPRTLAGRRVVSSQRRCDGDRSARASR